MSAFTPQFLADSDTLVAALRMSWAHPLDATPLSIVADILDDYGDVRGQWVRTACRLWEYAVRGVVAKTPTTWERLQTSLERYGVTKSPERHRVAVMYAAFIARCAPMHDGRMMCDIWSDGRISQVNHWCLLRACGLVDPKQAEAVRSTVGAVRSTVGVAQYTTWAAQYTAWAAWHMAWAAQYTMGGGMAHGVGGWR